MPKLITNRRAKAGRRSRSSRNRHTRKRRTSYFRTTTGQGRAAAAAAAAAASKRRASTRRKKKGASSNRLRSGGSSSIALFGALATAGTIWYTTNQQGKNASAAENQQGKNDNTSAAAPPPPKQVPKGNQYKEYKYDNRFSSRIDDDDDDDDDDDEGDKIIQMIQKSYEAQQHATSAAGNSSSSTAGNSSSSRANTVADNIIRSTQQQQQAVDRDSSSSRQIQQPQTQRDSTGISRRSMQTKYDLSYPFIVFTYMSKYKASSLEICKAFFASTEIKYIPDIFVLRYSSEDNNTNIGNYGIQMNKQVKIHNKNVSLMEIFNCPMFNVKSDKTIAHDMQQLFGNITIFMKNMLLNDDYRHVPHAGAMAISPIWTGDNTFLPITIFNEIIKINIELPNYLTVMILDNEAVLKNITYKGNQLQSINEKYDTFQLMYPKLLK